MTRIYTRSGDGGDTGLFGGQRVRKDDLRVRAYGAVDEANASIGAARAAEPGPEIDAVLARVQHHLFDLGAELATPPAAPQAAAAHVPRVAPEWVAALERDIDHFEDALPPLRAFILPGGTPGGAALHVARTVVRRAERDIVTLAAASPVNPDLLRFINRLSDLLFVLARAANHRTGAGDVTWSPTR